MPEHVAEEKPREMPGGYTIPQLSGWAAIENHYKDHDEGMIKNLDDDINTLLVFAGLFSAVVTGFVIEFYTLLQEDSGQIAVTLLAEIASQLHNRTNATTVLPSPLVEPFCASSTSRIINTMWFLSLVLSLAAALLGMMAKQWMREYLQWTSLSSEPRDVVRLRQSRFESWEEWGVTAIVGTIPALLEIALLLFLAGMATLLWTLDTVVFVVVSIAIAILFSLAFATIILPILSRRCPYKSPISWGLLVFYNWVCHLFQLKGLGPPGTIRSWRQRDAYAELSRKETLGVSHHFYPGFFNRTTGSLLSYADEALLLVKALAWVRCDSQDPRLLQSVSHSITTVLRKETDGNTLLLRNMHLLCQHLGIGVYEARQYLAEAYTSHQVEIPLMEPAMAYTLSSVSWNLQRIVRSAFIQRDTTWCEAFRILLELLAKDIEDYILWAHDPERHFLYDYTVSLVEGLCFLQACYKEADRAAIYCSTLTSIFDALSGTERTSIKLRHPGLRTFVFQLLLSHWDLCSTWEEVQLDDDTKIVSRVDLNTIVYNVPPPLTLYYSSGGYSSINAENGHLFVWAMEASLRKDSTILSSTLSQHLLLALSEAIAACRELGIENCGSYTHTPWIESLGAFASSDARRSDVPPALIRNLEKGLKDGLITVPSGSFDAAEEVLQELREACQPHWNSSEEIFMNVIQGAKTTYLECVESNTDFFRFFHEVKTVFQHFPPCLLESEHSSVFSVLADFLDHLVHALELTVKRKQPLGSFFPRTVHSQRFLFRVWKDPFSWINPLFSLAEYPRTYSTLLRIIPERLIELLLGGLDQGLIMVELDEKELAIECVRELEKLLTKQRALHEVNGSRPLYSWRHTL